MNRKAIHCPDLFRPKGDMIRSMFVVDHLKEPPLMVQLFWLKCSNFNVLTRKKVGKSMGYPVIVDAVFHIVSYYKVLFFSLLCYDQGNPVIHQALCSDPSREGFGFKGRG